MRRRRTLIAVLGLAVAAVAYTCSVRAKAKAGYSAWSKGKRVVV